MGNPRPPQPKPPVEGAEKEGAGRAPEVDAPPVKDGATPPPAAPPAEPPAPPPPTPAPASTPRPAPKIDPKNPAQCQMVIPGRTKADKDSLCPGTLVIEQVPVEGRRCIYCSTFYAKDAK